MSPLTALALVPLGLAAGRVARRAADNDRRRREGGPRSRGWRLEVATAVVLAALGLRLGPTPSLGPLVVLVAALAGVTLTDLRSRRIPDRITGPALAAVATTTAVVAVLERDPTPLLGAAAASAALSGLLGLLHLLRPDGLGRGDVKLAAVIGAAVGGLVPAWGDGLVLAGWVLLGSAGLGLVWAAVSARRRPDRALRPTTAIPFAPSLAAAAIAVALAAEVLVGPVR